MSAAAHPARSWEGMILRFLPDIVWAPEPDCPVLLQVPRKLASCLFCQNSRQLGLSSSRAQVAGHADLHYNPQGSLLMGFLRQLGRPQAGASFKPCGSHPGLPVRLSMLWLPAGSVCPVLHTSHIQKAPGLALGCRWVAHNGKSFRKSQTRGRRQGFRYCGWGPGRSSSVLSWCRQVSLAWRPYEGVAALSCH